MAAQRSAMSEDSEGDTPTSNQKQVTRHLTVDGQVITIGLDVSVWQALEEVSVREGRGVEVLVAEIGRNLGATALESAVHAYLTRYFKDAAQHDRGRHGLSESDRVDSVPTGPLASALDAIGPPPKR